MKKELFKQLLIKEIDFYRKINESSHIIQTEFFDLDITSYIIDLSSFNTGYFLHRITEIELIKDRDERLKAVDQLVDQIYAESDMEQV